MRVSLIVAVADNGTIGRDGGLPWRLSNDLRYFRNVTMGKPIVMGRKTYESIGRPLPGRPNVVVSATAGFAPDGVDVAADFETAVARAEALADSAGADEILVIGGAALYRAALARADRIYFTEVHAEIDGDVHFPVLDPAHWREIARERHEKGERDEYDHSFVVLDRVVPGDEGA